MGVCAFVRGGEVLAAAAVDPFVTPRAPEGWRDVLGVDGLLLCVAGGDDAGFVGEHDRLDAVT